MNRKGAEGTGAWQQPRLACGVVESEEMAVSLKVSELQVLRAMCLTIALMGLPPSLGAEAGKEDRRTS